jgi:hypothetical protein
MLNVLPNRVVSGEVDTDSVPYHGPECMNAALVRYEFISRTASETVRDIPFKTK